LFISQSSRLLRLPTQMLVHSLSLITFGDRSRLRRPRVVWRPSKGAHCMRPSLLIGRAVFAIVYIAIAAVADAQSALSGEGDSHGACRRRDPVVRNAPDDSSVFTDQVVPPEGTLSGTS
jgi:hypothetical protein